VTAVHALKQALGLERGGEASSTWVEVSSAETISVSHLSETRSSMMSTAIPAAVKCVVS
jgi:hypothetical protein